MRLLPFKKKEKKLLHYVVFFEIMVFGNNQSINAHNQLGNERKKKKIWIDFTESINKKKPCIKFRHVR